MYSVGLPLGGGSMVSVLSVTGEVRIMKSQVSRGFHFAVHPADEYSFPPNRFPGVSPWMQFRFIALRDGAMLFFPYWPLVAATAILPVYVFVKWLRRKPVQNVCNKCGYDLRASKIVCPECGEKIDLGTHEGKDVVKSA